MNEGIKEKQQIKAVEALNQKELPPEVNQAILNLAQKKDLYNEGIDLVNKEKDKLGPEKTRQKTDKFKLAIMETDNLIGDIKKYVDDDRVKTLCGHINLYFAKARPLFERKGNSTGTNDRLAAIEEELEKIRTEILSIQNKITEIIKERKNLGFFDFENKGKLTEKKEALEEKQKDKLRKEKYLVQEREDLAKTIGDQNPQAILQKLEKAETETAKYLTDKETERIAKLASLGRPEASEQATMHILRQYNAYANSLTTLPKARRDQDLRLLQMTVAAYQDLLKPEFMEEAKARIRVEATKILKEQSDTFNNLRGVIQKMGQQGTELAVSTYEVLSGDQGSLMLKILKASQALNMNLLKPVTYDEKIIKKLENDVVADLESVIAVAKNKEATIQNLDNQIMDLLNNRKDILDESDKTGFLKAFSDFTELSLGFNQNLIRTQSDMITKAWLQTHGEKNSMFPADKQSVKFLDPAQLTKLITDVVEQFSPNDKNNPAETNKITDIINQHVGGINLWRLVQYLSPGGVLLPEEVELKSSPGSDVTADHVTVKSIYETGWFKQHPIGSLMIETGQARLIYLGIQGVKTGGEKILSKLPGFLAVRGLRLGFKIVPLLNLYFAYQEGKAIGQAANDRLFLTGAEERILEKISKKALEFTAKPGVESLDELCQEELQELRRQILLTEIGKKREAFQSVGFDLGKLGYGFWDKFKSSGLEIPLPFNMGKDMKTSGALKDAFRSANKRLLMLGLELFPYPEEVSH